MIKQLQGLRGIMCLSVILNHWSIIFYSNLYLPKAGSSDVASAIGNSPLNVFFDGNLAVIVFFTLSGFLLARSVWKKSAFNLIDVITKRYIRLFPCVFVSIMIMFLLMSGNLLQHSRIVPLIESDYVLEYNMFQPKLYKAIYEGLIGTFIHGSQYNSPLWTIHWEIFAGGGIAVLVYFAKRKKWLWRACVYFAAIVLSWLLDISYFICFVLGAVIADLQQNEKKIASWIRGGGSVATIAALYLVSVPTNSTSSILYGIFNYIRIPIGYVHMMGAALLIYVLLHEGFLAKLLSASFLVKLGNISYSVYTVHWIVILSLGCGVFRLTMQTGNYDFSALLTAVISVVASVFLGWIFNRYVENFLKGLKKKQKDD